MSMMVHVDQCEVTVWEWVMCVAWDSLLLVSYDVTHDFVMQQCVYLV